VTVSKRVDKRAVGRNRLRRQCKEVFRLQRASLPVGDYVLLAKPDAGKLDNAAVRAELTALFERARRLPTSAISAAMAAPALNPPTPPALNEPTPPGTMPPSDAPHRRDATDH
jgi:ribonuclease P protein component